MPPERLGQIYCLECNKAVGLSGQETAYSSLLHDGWLCPKHNEVEARKIKSERLLQYEHGNN